MENGQPGCCLISSLLCLVVLGILAVLSLGAVPPLFYGIRYNAFNKAAQTEAIYKPGRYFIGPWNSFLLFPSNVQTIEFANEPRLESSGTRYEPLHTRTKDGLGLHLQVSLQYRLGFDKVGPLYSEFNMNYEQVFQGTLRDTMIKAASEYNAPQLWGQRQEFGDMMQKMVNEALQKMYAECWGLQLMIIDLPDMYEASIVHTQVQKQQVRTNLNQQLSMKIAAETTVIMAEYDKQVRVIGANAEANYTYTTKRAQAHARQKRIDTEAQVLTQVKNNLKLGPEELVVYQRYGALADLDTASVFYNFGNGSRMMIQASVASR